MLEKDKIKRIALTGFMGVGKSTVCRRLASILRTRWCDLDSEIEHSLDRSIADIVEKDGIEEFRRLESVGLSKAIENSNLPIISLGGGAFTIEANRKMLSKNEITSIWLEAGFDHCWANIRSSYKVRPLAKNRGEAVRLFEERIRHYCLADWHFIVEPGCNSADVAVQIAEQVYGVGS